MASLPAMASASISAYSSSFSISPQFSPPFFPKTTQLPIRQKAQKPLKSFTCKSKDGEEKPAKTTPKSGETSPGKLDRRNLLLGGLYYGGASFAVNNPVAFAAPVAFDFNQCAPATSDDDKPINCCPPGQADKILPYAPSYKSVTRTRMSAQTFTTDSSYYKKYKKAIQKMKNLPLDDPRNFTKQANVHCAYCDGAYTQVGYPDLLFEIHGSWLFFPWHRWYLYFFEKICANLIDDDTFALPFWNWDDPNGMKIPDIYIHDPEASPLYDRNRNPEHLPPAIIDLDWPQQKQSKVDPDEQIFKNLFIMHRQMITQAKSPTDFFGHPYRAGDDIDVVNYKGRGFGTIERCPHNNVHLWTGLDDKGKHEGGIDMGYLYSAGRDPIFYAHHANIDRMWNLWLNPLGKTNLTDPDWLDVTFVFYNEEAKPVRVRIGDCVDTTKLGYTYEDVPIEWLYKKPTPRAKARASAKEPLKLVPRQRFPSPQKVFPKMIDTATYVMVKRPKSGTGSPEEILIIEGLEYDKGKGIKLNVYINEDDVDQSGPEYTEYLGSFSNLPHARSMKAKTNLRFRISEVLNDLGASNEESVLVTLVPVIGTTTVNDVKIEFDDDQSPE